MCSRQQKLQVNLSRGAVIPIVTVKGEQTSATHGGCGIFFFISVLALRYSTDVKESWEAN